MGTTVSSNVLSSSSSFAVTTPRSINEKGTSNPIIQFDHNKIKKEPAELKRIFGIYDLEAKGWLDKEQSILFLRDLLHNTNGISVIETAIQKEIEIALSKSKKQHQIKTKVKKEWKVKRKKNPNWYLEYVLTFFHEVDPEISEKIYYEKFVEILKQNWNDFYKKMTKEGNQREMIVKIRLSRQENLKQSKNSNNKKSRRQDNELKACDDLWNEQIEEEQLENEEEEKAKNSIALSIEEISKMRSEQISRVSEILQIKAHVIQKMLDKMDWNEDKLLMEYLNDGKEFLKKIGLSDSSIYTKKNKKKNRMKTSQSNQEISCSICFEDYLPSEFASLDSCKHSFCKMCWKSNLEMSISEGRTLDIFCMQQGCQEIVPVSLVEELVDLEFKEKYSRYLSKTYVNHHKRVRWCPAPGCEFAIMDPITQCKCRAATCACGNRICWDCGNEAHPPITCKMLKKWNKLTERDMGALGYIIKNKVDMDTLQWLHENTKPCPFCTTAIQKNSGCFFMSCTNCYKSFCWYCGDSWESHYDHFSCAKYNVGREHLGDKPENLDEAQFQNQKVAVEQYLALDQRKKSILERFTENYPKFDEVVQKANDISYIEIDKKHVKQMEMHAIFDTGCILKARLVIKTCRESLKYSYVHLSLLPPTTSTSLLQHLQENMCLCITALEKHLASAGTHLDVVLIRKHTLLTKSVLDALHDQIFSDEL